MAEEKDDVIGDEPKKAARKRTRAAAPKSGTAASKDKQAALAPNGGKADRKTEAPPEPAQGKSEGQSEDLWDQTAKSLSKVDWGQRGQHLFRAVLMLFAAIATELSVFVIYFLTTVHFLYTLITGQKLDELTAVCGRFTVYIRQLLDFISYRSDEPLFPFAPFPEAEDAK